MSDIQKLHRISVKEAAEMIGVSQWTVYRAIQDGRLPIARLLRGPKQDTYIIYKEWVEAFIRGER